MLERNKVQNTEMGVKPSATWIWYPGDFEVWLGNIFNNRRTERGAMFPPFWKQDSHWPTVAFSTEVSLTADEEIYIWAEGHYNFMLDGKLQFGEPDRVLIPKGVHHLNFKVWNQATPPALFVDGKTIRTGSHWLATYEDKIWIDENGVAHGSGVYVPAGRWNFDQCGTPPSKYRLPVAEREPMSAEAVDDNTTLYDFGAETFGYIKFRRLRGSGNLDIYYGESREEALDKEHCETLDRCRVYSNRDDYDSTLYPALASKAFRYVLVERHGVRFDSLLMDYEYAPWSAERSGAFRCSDDEVNRIWNVSAYTLDLTTREFFVDGIKRDRWTWSGDAIQSYLMNYYLRFDTECVKRTIRQLRGKDPVTAHVNTIMDYTFYWFKSILDYYDYTGDLAFVREMYPRMQTLADYVLGRTNADGLAEGRPDDWIFVDWVDFPMHKRGVLAFEQILFAKSMEVMARCGGLLQRPESERYASLARQVLDKTRQLLWSDTQHAWLHAIEDGQLNTQVTKFPNMFAILYGYADSDERAAILRNVLLNDAVPPINTPYMRFYELEALCMCGEHRRVLEEMKSYWGGMLRKGATSFWEKYNPEEHGAEHLAMYGRPYGKSLCHAWGASPLYLLGRYFLGVRPTKPGYEEYEVCPVVDAFEWMSGYVPTPFGRIQVIVHNGKVDVCSDGGRGVLVLGDRRIDIPAPGYGLSVDIATGEAGLVPVD